jgi:hypothetical protein
MSRSRPPRFPPAPASDDDGPRAILDSGRIAEDIGMVALYLARRARAAGLTTISHLLEGVALEAGSEAATRQWPRDASQH